MRPLAEAGGASKFGKKRVVSRDDLIWTAQNDGFPFGLPANQPKKGYHRKAHSPSDWEGLPAVQRAIPTRL